MHGRAWRGARTRACACVREANAAPSVAVAAVHACMQVLRAGRQLATTGACCLHACMGGRMGACMRAARAIAAACRGAHRRCAPAGLSAIRDP